MDEASIYVNGKLLGFHDDADELVYKLRKDRRKGKISSHVSIAKSIDGFEVYVNTDEGRLMRPVIIVENGKPLITKEDLEKIKNKEILWDELISMGKIEYLDAEEEENALIAVKEEDLTEKNTHLEMSPLSILGITATMIPYAEHNMANRDTFGVKMGKQAVSLYAPNYMLRNDTRSYILHYPEDSLVQTAVMKKVNQAKRPVGTNFVVAIATYYGYNIKDAVVLNKAAVDRGLGRTTFFRTYQSEELKYPGGQKDRFEIPNEDISGYRGEDAYKNLGEDGIIMPETKVVGGELITAKTSPPRFLEEISEFGVVEEKRRENSDTVKIGEDGYVNNVIMTESETGNRLVKIKVRSEKIPEVGDKFASIHGQKGVVGAIIPQEDMPFTTNGIIPDLILNPHGIPSRMTVAHLIETLGGKVSSLNGRYVDGTPFVGEKEDALRSELHGLGFRSDGKERMYDGITGKIIEAEIFIGAVYYRRLHHLVSQKLQVRSRGPVQLLTRQPTEGKIREGGIRFGEMEKDCLVGHGAAMLLQERIIEESDKTTELVCEKCGIISFNDTIRRKNVCPLCGGVDVYLVEMSYAFKLLLDEMKSLGILPRIELMDKA